MCIRRHFLHLAKEQQNTPTRSFKPWSPGRMTRGYLSFLSNPHGNFQQGFDLDDISSWSSSTSTLAHSVNRSSPKSSSTTFPASSLKFTKRRNRRTLLLLLRMISEDSSPGTPIYDHHKRRGALSAPVSFVSPSPPDLPQLDLDTTAMRDPTGVLRFPLSTEEERTWLSFSSLGSVPKLDRHAIMAAHQRTSTPPPEGVTDTPRPALSAHHTWLVLQNVDRAFFREHGPAVARGTLKLGVIHESASVKILGCRVTVGRWHRAVWFEDECEHFKDPLAGVAVCHEKGPCALELHEFVRVNEAAFDKIPGPVKRALGYDKYVKA